MIATYRLSSYLASFEFFFWLVMVHTAGASEIVFDTNNPRTKKNSLDDVIKRFHSILKPGPALVGLPCRIGDDKTQIDAFPSHLYAWYNSGKRFARLKSVKPPVKCKATVTIRQNITAPMRDSNRDAWLRFADEIDAIVIDDFYRDPIHLHDRMALYAGAEMNYGVCNGPMAMLSLTEYPVKVFVNSESARNSNIRWGIEPNTSWPWMLSNQQLVWAPDDLDALMQYRGV